MSTALTAYRHLLRAARLAFHGDSPVLNAAQQQIREGFRQRASLSPSDPAVEPAIQHAEEVAQFLTANVVQGKKEGDVYRLRIHEETEKGDNDTIKIGGGKTIKIDGKKCTDR
ncbi:zinc maintenance protein [Phialemonium atrogriseum]|uniref:Mitochondrial zinc maintenance protein 1, mitochondrial n=1 Tax=Phialemonium atrogriseum TaxID=1093897 RepID=A0AAJ0BV80_9PEZI|nr:zinc maintenance protein [Phialemonium atrogriseum]KAK1765098.1 zinc maintenance protein [Phialemonium atrogriseum]